MSLIGAIEKRIATRLGLCRQSAKSVVETLRRFGVQAIPFGSSVKGKVHAESDLDILVLDCGKLRRGEILTLAEEAASVPVDILFAEDTTPQALKLIMQDVDHEHSVA